MMVYPDASFLVSWLYKPDPLNAKARSADALHVAILEQLNPDLFVSGDRDQLRWLPLEAFSRRVFTRPSAFSL